MAKGPVTAATAIAATKYALTPLASWPLPSNASYFQVLKRNIFLGLSIIHLMACCIPSMYNIYVHLDDSDTLVRVAAEITALLTVITKMLICKFESRRLQILIDGMQSFLNEATKQEMDVIQIYVDRCVHVHGAILIIAVVGVGVFWCGPLFSSQSLPGDTAYPFSIESYWIWTPLYISQMLIICQVGCTPFLDFMYGILLWYAAARFEMLSIDLARATDTCDIRRCVQNHQKLLQYVDELRASTCIMALEVTAIAVLSITAGGFVIIRSPPWFTLAKFTFFEIVVVVELFLLAWPADYLKEMGENIGYAAYTCAWIGQSPKMMKDITIIIQRSRIPLQIVIEGLLPSLSLEFYATVLSASFTYITALRAFTEP